MNLSTQIIFLILAANFLYLTSHAELSIKTTTPIQIKEEDVEITETQTITGPHGTRTIKIKENSNSQKLPFSENQNTASDVEVDGVENPGIQVGTKTYGTPNGMTTSRPAVTGGPGKIHTESSIKKRFTPNVQIQIK